jgi:Uma2 family endonuclease
MLDGGDRGEERCRMTAAAPRPPQAAEEPDLSGLITEDETPVDNILSEKQQRLLTEPLYSSWSGPPPGEDGERRPFAALANVGLFPSLNEPPLVPDMMLSLDVTVADDLSEKKSRSYFVWQFGKPPDVVVEIVSNNEGGELGERLRRYRRMRIAYYVVHDPLHVLGKPLLRTFELRGELYVPIDRPWFESIGLGLVEWEGVFEGLHGRWLRWCTRDGQVIPTGAERAAVAEARAETAEARAETAEARAKRLAERLRELGIEPNGDG